MRSWRVPGWVRVDSSRSAHRPYPDHPDRTMCGLPIPRSQIITSHSGNLAPCETCSDIRAAALEAAGDPRSAQWRLENAQRPRTWEKPGWVQIGRHQIGHRPNLDRPERTMCDLRIPNSQTVSNNRL